MATWIYLVILTLAAASANEYGDLCSTDADCSTTNTECRDEAGNTGMSRCMCDHDYVAITEGTTPYCGLLLHTGVNSACESCENNNGVCFQDDTNSRDCLCPSTRSGTDCNTINVEVHCSVTGLTMDICYTPHSSLDMTEAVVNTDGMFQDMACNGHEVTTAGTCSVGDYEIQLKLGEDRCGVILVEQDVHTKRYEVVVVAHEDKFQLSQTDYLFKAYCSYETYADTTFQGLGVISIGRSDRGQLATPTLSLAVLNLLDDEISPGIPLRLGDQIKLKITLTQDTSYNDLLVVRCTASTKGTIPDPTAITVPLIANSCPYSGQSIITTTNLFGETTAGSGIMQTGSIKMFKMAQGNSVHFHCVVKLCLTGSESGCDQPTCGSRKKRSDINLIQRSSQLDKSVEVSLHKAIRIADEDLSPVNEEEDSRSPMLFIIVGAVGVLMLSMAIIAVLLYRNVVKHIKPTTEVSFVQSESGFETVKGKTTGVSSWSMDSGVVSTPSPDPSLKVVL